MNGDPRFASRTRLLAAAAWSLLISHRTCVVLLFGLFVVTWAGTLYQVDHGLYAAQRAYFESWFVLQRIGDLFVASDVPAWLDDLAIAVPIPGGMLLMTVLAANLVCGGMVRIARSMRSGSRVPFRIGVMTVHVGIAILLLAGFVRFRHADEGSLTLLEGRSARSYQSFHEWEIAVQRQVGDDRIEEHLIRGEDFLDATPQASTTFRAASLPFTVVVRDATRNGEPRPGERGGFVLHRNELLPENERNIAACEIEIRRHGATPERTLLWGLDVAGYGFECDGETYGLQLRKRTWPLPFAIRLDRFTAEMHPGTSKPKAFVSEVTVFDAAGDESRARVEMNEPLRRGDVVVYQSTWGRKDSRPDGALFSGFQVVRNVADQWPLIGCIVMSAGMLLAFGVKLLRFLRSATSAAVVVLAFAGAGSLAAQAPDAATPHDTPSVRTTPYPVSVLDVAERMPVQEDGRLKPLLTHASYLLLRVHGRRTLRLPDEASFGPLAGTSVTPTEWALDMLLFPEQADRYPAFLLQSSEVADAIQLGHDQKRKRDRYSYDELRPALGNLFTLARRYGHRPEAKRSGIEQQVVLLAQNVSDYQRLSDTFAPARRGFADWLGRRWQGSASPDRELETLLASVSGASGFLRLVPPSDPARTEWLAPGDLVGESRGAEAMLAIARRHERIFGARTDMAALAVEFAALDAELQAAMERRGEGDALAMEVAYLRADWVWRALYAFGLAFVCACLGALSPRRRVAWTATHVATWVGIVLLVTGIVLRCVLRDRPPITGLYDTILFVTASGAIAAMVLERLQRRRIALSLAAVLGFFGCFVAGRFEQIDGRDTMPTLLAVLDTNFWLATHVTIINLGYAGALLAGFLAHVSLLAPWFRRGTATTGRSELGPSIYGTLCFATLFTTVGTILGGIWANDSWGRFWGWDPKENGALMIVLWNLLILHSRLGGLVRDHGVAMLAVAGNVVVVFSWFHTNLLGVGLHSYGFASGLSAAVWTFYMVEFAVLFAGWLGARRRASMTTA